ncbi:MAG: ATP-grasp domain-containing protein [Planctomycetaceae bacterium]|jgi:predicted ATP-grasp superfamily ATP-dependent carboligase|nr:ATP-grasp domain-containing protein [Planctomycetaceae bacterium]
MRVFVSEYVCGGAWPEETLDSSLAAEGRAMLISLVQDMLRLSDVEVVTTWDNRLGAFPLGLTPTLTVESITSPRNEQQVFERLCEQSDAAFAIAPEFHGILTDRVRTASVRTRLVGCSVEATALCSDKLRLAAFLDEASIPTVSTETFEPASEINPVESGDVRFPCVIKPRDGAGSFLIRKVSNSNEFSALSKQLLTDGDGLNFVRQPFIDGVAISCAAIVTAVQGGEPDRLRIDVLPPCQQILSNDGCFAYEGADFPARITPLMKNQIERLVHRCCSVIPGLNGYVGFDLLVPHAENDEPTVVEINPRLTTGFLLWQKTCKDNLVARMLALNNDDAPTVESPLSWKPAPSVIRMNSLIE